MEKVIKYVAIDGTSFHKEDECLQYEKDYLALQRICGIIKECLTEQGLETMFHHNLNDLTVYDERFGKIPKLIDVVKLSEKLKLS